MEFPISRSNMMRIVLLAGLLLFLLCACTKQTQQAPVTPLSSSGISIAQVPDFRYFIRRFFEEPDFQINHIHFPIRKEWKDIDHEFAVVNESIEKQDWKHLPAPKHYECTQDCYDTVIYDNFFREFQGKTERVLAFEGVGNGINNALYFKLENGEWMLVKWEDFDD